MTPDQIYFRLSSLDNFKTGSISKQTGMEARTLADSQGLVKGRDKHGNPIKARITGKSLASRIREQKEAEKAKEPGDRRRKRRRGR